MSQVRVIHGLKACTLTTISSCVGTAPAVQSVIMRNAIWLESHRGGLLSTLTSAVQWFTTCYVRDWYDPFWNCNLIGFWNRVKNKLYICISMWRFHLSVCVCFSLAKVWVLHVLLSRLWWDKLVVQRCFNHIYPSRKWKLYQMDGPILLHTESYGLHRVRCESFHLHQTIEDYNLKCSKFTMHAIYFFIMYSKSVFLCDWVCV